MNQATACWLNASSWPSSGTSSSAETSIGKTSTEVALAEAQLAATDPGLYEAMGESAAAFGQELRRRGVRPFEPVHPAEDPEDSPRLAELLSMLDERWPQ